MTAKEYLRQLSRKDARIKALLERQRRYRELAERRTAVYRDMPGGGQRHVSSVEEYATKIIDLEREIVRRIDEYADLTREVEAAIDRIGDDRYRDILRFRYVNGWGWERIAQEMHYDERWVRRLHGWALLRVEIPEDAKHARKSPF
ncbi:MAG TPA: hypothetical protein IAA84_07025 [Candidatus Alectryocaccomicrobium excrementavium]|uniref:RNA polymerase subunit sigma-70 n=1 Tax=Candidatus Alectryocaccomicrobium excrementavium TaxID=2840668 RepID=A0A9D1K5W8_9FIRM|nr:hypothetical protein [Candidatus Alectryocaccomicrobium excrementavium]